MLAPIFLSGLSLEIVDLGFANNVPCISIVKKYIANSVADYRRPRLRASCIECHQDFISSEDMFAAPA